MKDVLIICGSFPPQSFVGGLRPAMFTKYLPGFGWNPWVLTRDFTPEDPRYDEKMPVELPLEIQKQVLRVKHSLKDELNYFRSRNIFQKIRDFFYPEYSSPPGIFFAAKKPAEQLISKQRFDLILATIPDQWELTLGAYLSKKFKIPLIADFRDILEQEYGLKRPLRQRLHVYRFAVRRWVTTKQAGQITTISKHHKEVLQKKLRRPTAIVYNGYDENKFKPQANTTDYDRPFKIIYVGRILDLWYRNPYILFEAIDQLIFEKRIATSDIKVEFYGTDKAKLDAMMLNLRNKDFIKFYERIPYSNVPQKLNEAQMLLLLTNNGRKGILTTKLFEYAGVQKPILCIPGDQGELDELIRQYNLGYSISSIKVLKEKLIEWIRLFKTNQFPVHTSNDIEFFTRENQARLLAEIFNKASENNDK